MGNATSDLTHFTLPARSETLLIDVLALADRYLTLEQELVEATDRRADLIADFEYGCDDEFRAHMDARRAAHAEVARLSHAANGAHDELRRVVEANAGDGGVWSYSGLVNGLRVQVRYEPVTHSVTAWRTEAAVLNDAVQPRVDPERVTWQARLLVETIVDNPREWLFVSRSAGNSAVSAAALGILAYLGELRARRVCPVEVIDLTARFPELSRAEIERLLNELRHAGYAMEVVL